ncbi:MAG TPA: hypothetical protein VGG99_00315 [Acetobacteraceae bacterium]|jgi:hypothetical protein
MGDLNTPPAEAYAPDPDREDPDSPDLMPEWLAYLIALVILFLLEQFQAARRRHVRRSASRHAGRNALPRDSAEAPAAATRSQSNHMTARTRRSRDTAPECADLSGARAALLEKLRQSDVDPAVLSQLEALGIVPRLVSPDTAATPTAPALAPRCVANFRRNPRKFAPAGARHRVLPTPSRRMSANPGTGPPTGPPAASGYQSCYA